MYLLYDTRTVRPLDRYDHYRAGAAAELAPVAVHGRSPGHLLATMSVAQVGDFEIEAITWAADSEVVARRTERLIRACDPESYRIFLSVDGGLRMEQAGSQVSFRARDIALYDISRPWQSTHPTGSVLMRAVMLTFPRALLPIAQPTVRSLVGTVMPRSLPGRSLIAQFLIGLTDAAITDEQARGVNRGPSERYGDKGARTSRCWPGPRQYSPLGRRRLRRMRAALEPPDASRPGTPSCSQLNRCCHFCKGNGRPVPPCELISWVIRAGSPDCRYRVPA